MENKNIQFNIGKRVIRSGAVLAALIACMSANADHLSGSTSSSDTSFIKDAAKGGQMEVKLGQLASDTSQNAQIKSFGERLVKDHSQANEELMKLAQTKGVNLTSAEDHAGTEANKEIKKFSSKTGADFDKAYIRHMVSDHKKDISKFEKEATQSDDPDVKAFAQKTLPTLREHLRMAEDIARSMGINTASYSTSTDNSAEGSGATISTERGSSPERDSSNPSLNVDTKAGPDKTSQGSVNIHTGEPNDGKTLGVTTEKGDGKTLGLNTDKNDGKLLGVVPDPNKKDHSASVDVNTSGDQPAVGSPGVNVDTGRNSASASVNTSSGTDTYGSAQTETRPKTKWFSTDKNDGKLWGIFPAPHHKKRADMNANTGSAAGSAPSTSSDTSRSNP